MHFILQHCNQNVVLKISKMWPREFSHGGRGYASRRGERLVFKERLMRGLKLSGVIFVHANFARSKVGIGVI